MRRSLVLLVIPVLPVLGACELVFPINPPPPADASGPGGPGPQSFTSPGPAAALYGGYAKAFPLTIAADDPTATIYYTIDGSTPDLTSPSGPSPVSVTVSTTSTVRYFGVTADGQAAPKTETFGVAIGAQQTAGYLVTHTTLDATTPVVTATAGTVLTGHANIQFWVQPDCATCAAQLVYGIDKTDLGCLFDGGPGAYPGTSKTAVPFTVTVPSTVGVHEVRVAHIEQTSCATAMASHALATRPTVARIGVIVVR